MISLLNKNNNDWYIDEWAFFIENQPFSIIYN